MLLKMTCKQLGEKGPLLAERWKDGATIIIIIIIIIISKYIGIKIIFKKKLNLKRLKPSIIKSCIWYSIEKKKVYWMSTNKSLKVKIKLIAWINK